MAYASRMCRPCPTTLARGSHCVCHADLPGHQLQTMVELRMQPKLRRLAQRAAGAPVEVQTRCIMLRSIRMPQCLSTQEM
jgi:hypothetical protein